MKSLITGILIAACLIPLDAYAGCRKRFRVKQVVVKQVVQPQVVNNYYYPPERAVVYGAPPPVSVNMASIQPVYVGAPQQAVAAVCCPCPCPTLMPVPHPAPPHPAPVPDGQPGGGDPPAPPPAGDVPGPGEDDVAIQAIASRACVSCHGQQNPKGGLSLLDVSQLTREDRLSAAAKIMLGVMPPGKPEALTDAEAQAWLKWSERKTPVAP